MFDIPNGFFAKALKALSKYGPDPILAFVLFIAFLAALIHGGIDPLFALAGLVVILAGYNVRCVALEKHKERMAVLRVDNFEKTRGAPILTNQRKRLARRSKNTVVKGQTK